MKKLLLAALIVPLAGCSYLRSTTQKTTDPKTGVVTEITIARAFTFFDSSSNLQKFRNTPGGGSGTNIWVGGTSIGSLQTESSGTNFNQLIGVIVESAVKGAK